ncbi:MAG: glycosyltransferase [Candidatus Heimdallarchaeota archaeon]|nr:glycosyltransferase [Candidatus Heimdallarchaeota archaeon]
MALNLLTILAIIYLSIVIISFIYYILITIDYQSSYSTEEFAKLIDEPFVSVIVPTFNEESNIVKCLKSLRSLDYSNYEIILSDGGSIDSTIELAAPFVDKIIIENEVPDNWVGKNYGCNLAYKVARGDILLFTDADTYHEPDSLSKTVSVLKQKNAGLVSLLPYQRLEKWWESIIPIYYILSHVASQGKKNVNNPEKSDCYMASGQYLLFDREIYERIGGHENLKGSIVEDFAFARVIKMETKALYYMDNHNLISARMYPDSVKHCWTGIKKCLYAGTKLTPPRRIIFTLLHILWGIFSPIAIAISVLFGTNLMIVLSSVSFVIYTIIMWTFWRGKGKHYWIAYMFLPFLMLVFITAMTVSTIEIILKNTTTWKGRTYRPNLKAGLEGSDYYAFKEIQHLGQLETDIEVEMISTNLSKSTSSISPQSRNQNLIFKKMHEK